MKLGDVVLIWGASGGLGSYATQMALAGGATPVCVVSSPEKAEICHRMGAELVIDRSSRGLPRSGRTSTHPGPGGVAAVRRDDPRAHRRPRPRHRLRAPGPGDVRRERLRRAPGRHHRHLRLDVSGFLHEYDNRYLWMNLKRIVGSHFANYREAWEANDLIARGLIHPTLSRTYALEDVGQAALRRPPQPAPGQGRRPRALAPTEGLGVTRPGPARSAPGRDQPVPQRLSPARRRAGRATDGAAGAGRVGPSAGVTGSRVRPECCDDGPTTGGGSARRCARATGSPAVRRAPRSSTSRT